MTFLFKIFFFFFKAEKLKARRKYGFTRVIYRMRNRTPFAAAAAAPTSQISCTSAIPVDAVITCKLVICDVELHAGP